MMHLISMNNNVKVRSIVFEFSVYSDLFRITITNVRCFSMIRYNVSFKYKYI